MRFTAIDFETANGKRASVCAVGLAVVEDGQVARRVRQLIRPQPLVFDPFNISIHGITEKDVADAPTFAEYWPSLWSNVQGPLAAHNASFDMSCLRHALDQSGTPYPETDYYCTRVLSRLAWPQHPTYALDHIAQSLGILFQHHDAEEDAVACALILLAACRQVNASTLADLQDTLGVRVGRMFKGGYWSCGGAYAPRTHGNRKPPVAGVGHPSKRETTIRKPPLLREGVCVHGCPIVNGKTTSHAGRR
jgi:DNA polymerase-3 subunit epsilon